MVMWMRGNKSRLESQIPRKKIASPPHTKKKKNSALEILMRKDGHWFVSSSAVKISKDANKEQSFVWA